MAIELDPVTGDILKRFFNDTNRGLLNTDFSCFSPWFTFPYDVFCYEGHVQCADSAALKEMFLRSSGHYAQIGATDLIRVIREVNCPTPHRLRCLYETRIITGRHTLHGDPFFCLSELVCTDGRWQVRRGDYDLPKSDAKHAVLIGTPLSTPFKKPHPHVS